MPAGGGEAHAADVMAAEQAGLARRAAGLRLMASPPVRNIW